MIHEAHTFCVFLLPETGGRVPESPLAGRLPAGPDSCHPSAGRGQALVFIAFLINAVENIKQDPEARDKIVSAWNDGKIIKKK